MKSLLALFLFFLGLGAPSRLLAQGELSLEGRYEQATSFTSIQADATQFATNANNGTDFLTSIAPHAVTNTYRITNTGDDDLNIIGFLIAGDEAEDFTMQTFPGGYIASGESELFTIAFVPSDRGDREAEVRLFSSDESHPTFRFAITGEGNGTAMISLRGKQSSSPSYGGIVDGTTTTSNNNGTEFLPAALYSQSLSEFRIDNNGVYPLRLYTNGITGPDEDKFTFVNFDYEIPPGESRTFSIRFTTETPGTFSATVGIGNSSTGNSYFTFAISGSSSVPPAPEISLSGKEPGGFYQAISDGDSTPQSSDGTDFGSCFVGSTVRRDFRITNSGDSDLVISAAGLSGSPTTDWSLNQLDAGGAGIVIPADSFHSFNLTFTPSGSGSSTVSLSISSNDGDENPYTITLRALGVELQEPGITVSGGSFFQVIRNGDNSPSILDGTDTGATALSQSRTTTFRITNSGNEDLIIDGASFAPSSAWSVTGLLSGATRTIASGQSHDFQITYSPQSIGSFFTTFTLSHNVPDERPYAFSLAVQVLGEPGIEIYGEAFQNNFVLIEDGDLNPDQSVTRFSNLAPGTSLTKQYQIRNNGAAPLTISSQSSSHPTFTINGLSTNIAAGTADNFTITYQADTAGAEDEAIITLANNTGEPSGSYTFALSGTSTANHRNVLAITQIVPDGNDLLLTCQGPSGESFRLLTSTTLKPNSWSVISGKTKLSPGTIRVINALPSPRRFYRLETE